MTRSTQTSGSELVVMVDELYEQVRKLSTAEFKRQFAGRPIGSLTLSPTAIANDAMIRVLQQRAEVKNEQQFFALAARFIRQLVLDYHKHRLAEKRGKGKRGGDVDQLADDLSDGGTGDTTLEALERLANAYPRKAEVVTLHIICGNTFDEIAEKIGISKATVERDWSFAKAWLASELGDRGE